MTTQPHPGRYVVESGSFCVVRNGIVVGSLGPWSLFGELALMYNAPRAATVTALSDSLVTAAIPPPPTYRSLRPRATGGFCLFFFACCRRCVSTGVDELSLSPCVVCLCGVFWVHLFLTGVGGGPLHVPARAAHRVRGRPQETRRISIQGRISHTKAIPNQS